MSETNEHSAAPRCYASWQCGKCGYPLVAGTCDNGCDTFPEEELTKLKQQVRAFLEWFNSDGSPCDGFRFREECDKLRQMVGA